MRVGKNSEAKKTRPCVVRLEKVNSPPSKMTRGGVTITSSGKLKTVTQHDDKKFKGPLKKRPITQLSTMMAAPRPRPKFAQRATDNIEVSSESEKEEEEEQEELPPTIAASRSRRAIKPNPKYASEDMVTPKIVKNVAILGNISAKRFASDTKQTINSESSSDDFFNRESSDELGEHDRATSTVEKTYVKAMDSKVSNVDTLKLQTPPTLPRKRGRPRKNPLPDEAQRAGTPQSAPRQLPTARTAPQVLQLRRTIANNALSKVPETQTTKKRKLDTACDMAYEVTNKRFVLSKKYATGFKDSQNAQSNDSQSGVRRSPMLNGNKILETTASDEESVSIGTQLKLRTNAASALGRSGGTANKLSLAQPKQRSSSPALTKGIRGGPNSTKDSAETALNKKKQQSPSSPGDDFETMPTFTIVNINDIINKKGDVLISKADAKASPPSANSASPPSGVQEPKLSRRKSGHTTILSEKIDPERLRTPQQRTPFPPKKPPQTILNHTMQKKTPPKEISLRASDKSKPAPRILNSMVAKKTQPVKPMIANLEDSADESIPLSIEEEEQEAEEDDGTGDTFNSSTRKSKNASVSAMNPLPKTPPAIKENSHAALNRQALKSLDKIVISRQGDKIIKRMTCFETWYVLNAPDEQGSKQRIIRNLLEMPLITLANAAKNIEFPSENWNSKVTLFEFSSSTVTKTIYTGDLKEHNIPEEDRAKYQPTCVMFRRIVNGHSKSSLPFDRTVIFKNKTFFTSIQGKNVRLVNAPAAIRQVADVEILLEILDSISLQSCHVELATTTH